MKALSLVRFSGKDPKKIMLEIKKIKGVEVAFLTFGRFDAVVSFTVPDIAGIKRGIKAIQATPGVKRTETLIGV